MMPLLGCSRLSFVLCIVVFLFMPARDGSAFPMDPEVSPDDEHWSGDFGRPGIDGPVYALTLFEGELIAGGDFSRAGDASVSNIARWDGTEWHSLGRAFIDPVHALIVYDGKLVAGGWRVASWDGAAWTPLGEGPPAEVNALAVYNGQLIAGYGEVYPPREDALRGLAKWDGTAWTAVGGGINGPVISLAVHAGSLIAGGSFWEAGGVDVANVARWDGTSWSALDWGPGIEVKTLLTMGDDLYAGGQPGPSTDGAPAIPLLRRWDGAAWHDVGAPRSSGGWSDARAITIHEGTLVAAAHAFDRESGSRWQVVRWNGVSWDSLFVSRGEIHALCEREGRLFVAGEIHQGESSRFEGIVQRTPSAWEHVGGPQGAGIAGSVKALAWYDGDVVAAGDLLVAGDEPVRTLARWDGSEWHAIPCVFSGGVRALEVFRGELIAAGQLNTEEGCPQFERIARWNGYLWDSLAQGLGAGIPLTMIVYRGNLIVGGQKMNIARWDGTWWSSLGAGIGPTSPGLDYWVSSFTEFNGDLIAAGRFRTAGTGPAAYTVARWDGTSWHSMGLQLGSTTYSGVQSVVAYQGALYAVGDFTPNDHTYETDVARWDGISWTVLPGSSIGVRELTTFGPHLIAGCCVSCRAAGVRRWDGSTWVRPGLGLTGNSRDGGDGWGLVDALLVHGSSLFVGGSFTSAGGKSSYAIARWDTTAAPPAPVLPPRPNPAAQNVAIDFELPSASYVTLSVYDVQGRRIAQLVEGQCGAGHQSVSWDGRSESGERVPSGVYLARLEAAGAVRSWKIVMAR